MKKCLFSFVLVLSASCVFAATLEFSTFLGTNSSDEGNGIHIIDNGEAIVTGNTGGSFFPTTSGSYDQSHNSGWDVFISKLAVDGSSLVFSTFLGGSDDDRGYGVIVKSGNAYITGQTSSSDFPTLNAYDSSLSGSSDAFITKFSTSGNTLEFSTFLGGSGLDVSTGFDIENSGNVYVTGQTFSSDFPTLNAYDSSLSGSSDAFITKFSTSGNTLEFSTFLGGSGSEGGYGITVESGNVYVTGETLSSDFPTLNAYDSSLGGNSDVFITKFSTSGNTLEFSTFLGGSGSDRVYGIAVESGNAYVTGETFSSDFPTLNAYDSSLGGNSDAYVTKLSASGNTLEFSTFLGGSSDETGFGITVKSENAYVTGITLSSDFPTQSPTDPFHNGSADLFITHFNTLGSTLEFSTFLGGGGYDSQSYIGNTVFLKNGFLLLTGSVDSGFPSTNGAFDESHNGFNDAILVRFQFPTGDLSPTSFLSSVSTNSSQSYTPQVQISNLDSNLTSITTNSSIEILFDGNQIYFDIQTVPEIAPLSDSTVIFAPLIPYKSGTYDVVVYTEFVGETDINNDTLYTSFEVLGDVAINEFLPIGNSALDPTFTEFFEIANTTNQAVDISNWQIKNSLGDSILVANGTSIPANSFYVFTKYDNTALNGGTPFDYFFNPTVFTFPDLSGYFLVENSDGQVVDSVNYSNWNIVQGESFQRKDYKLDSNDENSWGLGITVYGTENNKGTPKATSYYLGSVPGDLTPTSLLSSNSTNVAQSYIPQVQISNLDTIQTSPSTTTTMEINFGGTQIYSDTQSVSGVAPLSDLTVTFNSLIPYKSGTYDVVVYTELEGDTDASNDTLFTSFEVVGDLVINEFLPIGNSSLDPTFTEFFEIANTTNQAVDISNWQIRNSLGDTILVANGTSIPANSFFVFTKYDNTALNGGTPFDYFFNPTVFTFADSGGYFLVENSDGQIVDSVNYSNWNLIQGEAFERKNYKFGSNDENSWCLGTTVYGTENNKGTPKAISSCFDPVEVEEIKNEIVGDFSLEQNYPNPFNPTTTIKFSVKENSEVSIKIYNLKGEEVKTLLSKKVASGNHSVKWNGTDNSNKLVSSGIYFYRLENQKNSISKKLIFLK